MTDPAARRETASRAEPAPAGLRRQGDWIQAPGLLAQAGPLVRERVGGLRTLVVTDAHVAPLWLAPLERSLAGAGYAVAVHVIAPGEASKTPATA